ncbi:Crp/Fnr family transcriptional regulator [Dactylosporangium sp. AC04546]|uniref:Crp/Fnr family transcriptional regulator n=1 Tax=Dactylosporangium sp. AC04546 TaxID=2862460 RepID=UPI001EE1095E|nr:Crp/Fnr family transcriptional regulator [Dactylosporangium sp. AC04546]WVK87004.1 Crp/Fnr family transcriptional regulator [Dactylosporangium sp. AC04546]
MLRDEERAAILALGTVRQHPRGTTLIHEGSNDTDTHLILRGCVKVLGDTGNGHTTILAIRAAGDLVGELAALDGQPRSASVIAMIDTVTRVIDAATLESFLAAQTGVSRVLQRSITTKLRHATRLRVDLGGASVLVRLARVLYQLCLGYGRAHTDGLLVDVPLSQSDFAALIAASEPSVHRALADLRQAGVVQTRYRQIVICNVDKLKLLAIDQTPARPRYPDGAR